MTASLELADNQNCFACGSENKSGLRLKFKMRSEDEIETTFIPGPDFQGFKGIFHGGMMALLLDEIMVNLTWKRKVNAVSAEFKVRLKKAVRIGEKILFRGRIKSVGKRVVRTEATAMVSDQVVAEAEAICIRLRKEL